MKLNTQTDKRWAGNIMTFPKWQNKPDTLKQYGCLVASFANIIQMITGIEFTPADLNEYLITNLGYAYLRQRGNCKRGDESFILYDVIEKKWGLRIENVEKKEYKKLPNTHYICRFEVRLKNGKTINHYSNVITEDVIHGKRWFEIFNVYDGDTILLPVSEISILKRVTS